MNNKDNSKVPIAILSCFLIAFILQGILKISGVFIFEKALDWEIFNIIDNSFILQVIYYTIMTFVPVYCLCFALTTKPYGTKWYHHILILFICYINTFIKLKYNVGFVVHILFDILLYIILPIIINITTKQKHRFLNANLFNIILTITIQIALYFCYLGLCYWSNLLNSLLPQIPILLSASTNFLIQLELYIGVIMIMLSLNLFIKKYKENIMNIPMNIASDEAKEKELEEVKEKNTKKK